MEINWLTFGVLVSAEGSARCCEAHTGETFRVLVMKRPPLMYRLATRVQECEEEHWSQIHAMGGKGFLIPTTTAI